MRGLDSSWQPSDSLISQNESRMLYSFGHTDWLIDGCKADLIHTNVVSSRAKVVFACWYLPSGRVAATGQLAMLYTVLLQEREQNKTAEGNRKIRQQKETGNIKKMFGVRSSFG